MAIGNTVRALRVARDWTTSELAKRAGLSQSYVSEIENGKQPGRAAIQKLATALGVSVSDLMKSSDESTSLAWFWRSRFAAMKPSDVIRFRSAKIHTRVVWALKELLNVYGSESVAKMLGTTVEYISNILSGENDVSDWFLDQLTDRGEVPINFLLHGDPGPIDDLLRDLLNDRDCAAWLMLFHRARDNSIPPDILEQMLDTALMIRQ